MKVLCSQQKRRRLHCQKAKYFIVFGLDLTYNAMLNIPDSCFIKWPGPDSLSGILVEQNLEDKKNYSNQFL